MVDEFSFPAISFQVGALAAAGSTYILVALNFAIRTYREGRRSAEGGLGWRAFGLLLCAVWPIVISLIGFELWRRRKS